MHVIVNLILYYNITVCDYDMLCVILQPISTTKMAEYTSRTLKEAMQKDKDGFVLKRSELKSQVWESPLVILMPKKTK